MTIKKIFAVCLISGFIVSLAMQLRPTKSEIKINLTPDIFDRNIWRHHDLWEMKLQESLILPQPSRYLFDQLESKIPGFLDTDYKSFLSAQITDKGPINFKKMLKQKPVLEVSIQTKTDISNPEIQQKFLLAINNFIRYLNDKELEETKRLLADFWQRAGKITESRYKISGVETTTLNKEWLEIVSRIVKLSGRFGVKIDSQHKLYLGRLVPETIDINLINNVTYQKVLSEFTIYNVLLAKVFSEAKLAKDEDLLADLVKLKSDFWVLKTKYQFLSFVFAIDYKRRDLALQLMEAKLQRKIPPMTIVNLEIQNFDVDKKIKDFVFKWLGASIIILGFAFMIPFFNPRRR